MTITGKKTKNYSAYYFIHTISGINSVLIGDNLVNTYIDRNRTKYSYYIECAEECSLLEEHPDLKHIVDGDNSLIYLFEIPDKYKSNYRYFRNNEIDRFDDWFIEEIFKYSGYKYNQRRQSDGKTVTIVPLIKIDVEKRGAFITSMLNDIQALGLYDKYEDIPFVDLSYGITTWKGFNNLCKSYEEGKIRIEELERLVIPEFKYVEIEEEEFIENYKWG